MKKAIFVLQHNESYYLPMWVKYYSQFFAPEDIYILAHNCTDKNAQQLDEYEKQGYQVKRLTTEEIFDHDWLLDTIHTFQRELLTRYDYVVFTDCDEFLCPTNCTLGEFIDNVTEPAYRALGHDVIEDKMYLSGGFNKTLISRIPLTWVHGYHTAQPDLPVTPNLHLYHIHKLNYQEAWERNLRLSQEKWDDFAIANQLSAQNRIAEEQAFKNMFYTTGDLTEQSETLKHLLDYITK